MQRYCVCGIPIPINRPFCVECHNLYGSDRTKWPEWLRVWVSNYKHELDYETKASKREISLPEHLEA